MTLNSYAAPPGQILLSQRLNAAVEEKIATEQVAHLSLKGFSRPVPAYRVVGVTAEAEPG